MRKNRFLNLACMVLAFGMFVSSNPHVYARTQGAVETADYQVYDMSSGEITYHSFKDLPEPENSDFSPGYFPNGCSVEMEEPGFSVQAVVGTDNRFKITNTTVGPYCNTVYLETTYPDSYVARGSGFVIGPYAVATAAHCLYNEGHGGYAVSIKVIPAKNGDAEPYGSETVSSASSLVVSPEFVNNNQGDAHHDWGIIELSTDLGNSTGWLGLRWQSASYNGTSVYNTGYPATVKGASAGKYMYCGTGTVKSSATYIFEGTWDASAGNSGGPVYANYSETGYTAIGILTSGSNGTDGSAYPTSYSTATRITQDLYNLFVTYR